MKKKLDSILEFFLSGDYIICLITSFFSIFLGKILGLSFLENAFLYFLFSLVYWKFVFWWRSKK
ncbi:MAG: hypothetical protein K2G88_09510 [Oscillospiraceae bacterium]|nr:hypothetical protein [Oscillospiraceae bacterium]